MSKRLKNAKTRVIHTNFAFFVDKAPFLCGKPVDNLWISGNVDSF
jgi:hypothetical protein